MSPTPAPIPEPISRRQFLHRSAAATAAASTAASWGLAGAGTVRADFRHRWNEATDPAAEGLSAYVNHGTLFVRHDNLPVLSYRAQPSLKYPYFAQLNGPVSGLSLVTESALPYPHHRGLWLGCEPLEGGDYWSDGSLESGQIRSSGPRLVGDGKEGPVVFEDQCEWIREGAPSPWQDRRRFEVTRPREDLVVIDCEFEITARMDIAVRRAKHSFFAMRAAPDISPTYGGVLANSEGATGAEGTYGKPARWCGYHGARRLRPDLVEGIAILDHPSNFGGDCPWFTRDYGHLSPQPFEFLDQPFRLAEGDKLELNYRVALHAGTPVEAGLDALSDEWV